MKGCRDNKEIKRILNKAKIIAKKKGYFSISTGQIVEAILKSRNTLAYDFLNKMGISDEKYTELLYSYLPTSNILDISEVDFSKKVKDVLESLDDEFSKYDDSSNLSGSLFLLLGILLQEQSLAGYLIDYLVNDREDLMNQLVNTVNNYKNDSTIKVLSGENKKDLSIPTLSQVSKNLSYLAENNQLDPVIGREKEINRALQILGRRTKNNPIFRGEPGVGKTAIAEGVALKIASKEVPDHFLNKQIISLDMGSVVAGTKYRGEFENRMKKIIEEVKQNPNIILFIDELHTLIGAGGSEGSVDASNILKPALSRGEIQLMGATTFDEYQKYIEKDRAFERRFAVIDIEEPSINESIIMLNGLKEHYENYHNVKISDDAIESAVKLSERYITDKKLPDKAIDLIDEASSIANLTISKNEEHLFKINNEISKIETLEREKLINNQFDDVKDLLKEKTQLIKKQQRLLNKKYNQKIVREISKSDILEVISNWTNIPVDQINNNDNSKVVYLENNLHKRIIGQDKAVNTVVKAVKRAYSGLNDPNRPMGSFIFLGPTGVGKTELAKTIAKTLFGSTDALIRIDMSEYMSKENVSRLVGSAPGYIGYEEGGQLTEVVRRRPYSVILFDEVEKAHPDVFNLLLQVLDDGYLTDAKGRHINFKNTFIILTSNLGATELRDDKQVGFGTKNTIDDEQMETTMKNAMKQHFRPEFINRLDDIVVFNSLKEEQVEKIVKIMLSDITKRLEERNYKLKVTPLAIKEIAKEGYDVEYGARPLRRAIQNEIEDRLSDILLSNKYIKSEITIGYKKNQFYINY